MMEDYTSLNIIEHIPLRQTKEQNEEEMHEIMAEKTRQTYQNKTTKAQIDTLTLLLKNLERNTTKHSRKRKQAQKLYQSLEHPQPTPIGKITNMERSH